MSEIEEITIVPSRDIVDAKFIRYRGTDGRLREAVILYTDSRELVLYRKQISQLFRYLPARLNDIRKIRIHHERDEALREALEQCSRELVLSVADGRVIRVVTSDFTAIPHSKVLQIVEGVLRFDYEDRQVELESGMFAKWTLRSLPAECARLGEIVSWQLWVYNRNDGRHGLKIGGGFTVLRCKNGALGWRSAAKIRIIHRGDYENLLSKIQESVDHILNHKLPLIAYQIQEAQKVKAAKELVEKLIMLYPQWIQKKLREQLRTAHTVWDVSNAFSWVATHEPVTFNQRMQLSDHAVEVLKLVERR